MWNACWDTWVKHSCLNMDSDATCRTRVSACLTQDEQQLLSSTQSEHGDQTATFSVHDVMDGVTETSLPLLSLLVDVSSVGGFLTDRQTEALFTPPTAPHSTLCLNKVWFQVMFCSHTHSDEDVWFDARDLCCHQMSVLLTREISCVQQLHTHTHTHTCNHFHFSKPYSVWAILKIFLTMHWIFLDFMWK